MWVGTKIAVPHNQESVDCQVDYLSEWSIFGSNGSQELNNRSQIFPGNKYPEVEEESNECGDVDDVEIFLEQNLTCFAVHLGEGLFGNILIAMRDYLRVHEQLSAPVNVSKSFAAPINGETQDGALCLHICAFHISEIIQLRDQERFKGSVVSTDDPQ